MKKAAIVEVSRQPLGREEKNKQLLSKGHHYKSTNKKENESSRYIKWGSVDH